MAGGVPVAEVDGGGEGDGSGAGDGLVVIPAVDVGEGGGRREGGEKGDGVNAGEGAGVGHRGSFSGNGRAKFNVGKGGCKLNRKQRG